MKTTTPKKLRSELKNYLDQASKGPIKIKRRSGKNYILISEERYIELTGAPLISKVEDKKSDKKSDKKAEKKAAKRASKLAKKAKLVTTTKKIAAPLKSAKKKTKKSSK